MNFQLFGKMIKVHWNGDALIDNNSSIIFDQFLIIEKYSLGEARSK